jgi:hypothetical protein
MLESKLDKSKLDARSAKGAMMLDTGCRMLDA